MTIATLLPVAEPQAGVEWLHTEADAVGWAVDALAAYPPEDREFIRFVYLPPWADPGWVDVTNFAVNASAGHGRSLIRANVHANGWLLSYDLARLAPDPNDLAKLVKTWDGLAAEEPVFHVPNINVEEGQQAVLLAPHLQEALAVHATDSEKSKRVDVLLAEFTNSAGSIYPADFLIEQLLTSVRGKYPEFRQLEFKVEKSTPLLQALADRGFYLNETFKRGGEKGALILASGVTGKVRLVFAVYGNASRTPMLITYDVDDSRFRPDQHFARNLIEFEQFHDAAELLVPMENGLWEGWLADAAGNFQRAAPPTIVANYNKPKGQTHEIEMGADCFICHVEDGYKPFRNDLEYMVGATADFIGDEIQVERGGKLVSLTQTEALDIVVGRYSEPLDDPPDGILPRARRDFVNVVNQLMWHYQRESEDQPSSAEYVAGKLKEILYQYRYGLVDADRACLELGLRVEDGKGQEWLRKLTPPIDAQEDVMIALLKNGASIRRDDMSAVYVELARRAALNRSQLMESN